MSNERQDAPESIEWMTLPSLGPEAENGLSESLPPAGKRSIEKNSAIQSNTGNPSLELDKMLRVASVDQNPKGEDDESFWNDGDDNIEEYEEGMEDTDENEESRVDEEERVATMVAYLQELHAQIHNLGSTQQSSGAAGSEQRRGKGEDGALFEELLECYFDVCRMSHAKQLRGNEGDLEHVWQQRSWQPRLSAAKTEMIYQTLVDLGDMLIGHEPLDPAHMDHLRKVIPDMIKSAKE
ncbi:hypothetical protein BGZ73_004119 [Actinomortierella ambigua]|nr:hypothetical protein BGZ73_004119 [Actinomortierella ambigua]